MPEAIDRVLIDQISDLLFTTEQVAVGNLAREGINAARIRFVGKVMPGTVCDNRPRANRAVDPLAALPDGEHLVDENGLLTLRCHSKVDGAP